MSDLIDRQAAKNEIQRFIGYIDQDMINRINLRLDKLPSAEPKLLDDGTLIVTSNKYKDVKRVLVEDGKMFGSMFYADR